MATFGGYETVHEIFRHGLGSVARAKASGTSDGPNGQPDYVVKAFQPPYRIAGQEAIKPAVRSFLDRARTQQDVITAGGKHWAPVYEAGAARDGAYYVTTGQGTVKGNNLDHNPHCVITVSSRSRDLIFEGEAAKVSDVAKLERIARAYADQGWPAYVHDGVLDAPYSAPTTGPAPYDVYEVAPSVAFAFGTDEEKATSFTRYRF